jgi:hypothetical protein
MNYHVVEELWQRHDGLKFILRTIVADDGKVIGDNLDKMLWVKINAK